MAARVGAYRLHATRDSRELTRPAREAFIARFEREVDVEGVLPAAERTRRAKAALKAHMTLLAMKSAKSRRRTRAAVPDVQLGVKPALSAETLRSS